MKIYIDYYSAQKNLKQNFESSSGLLKQKKTLVLAFRKGSTIEFAFELPLSPSMGEMPKDTLEMASNGVLSKYSKIALSYYLNLIIRKKSLKMSHSSFKKLKVYTFGINETLKDLKENSIIRLKGSPKNIEEIIAFSHNTDSKWIVDFNGSLTQKDFIYFSEKVSSNKLLYIEQPLKEEAINIETNHPIWADESVKDIRNINELIKKGFSGFVIKPLHFDFDRLNSLIEESDRRGFPSIVGSVISDSLFTSFVKVVNHCTSTFVDNLDESQGDLNPVISETEAYEIDSSGKVSFNYEQIKKITSQFTLEESIELDISDL